MHRCILLSLVERAATSAPWALIAHMPMLLGDDWDNGVFSRPTLTGMHPRVSVSQQVPENPSKQRTLSGA